MSFAHSLRGTHEALAKVKQEQELVKTVADALASSNADLKASSSQLELFRKIITEKDSKTEYLFKTVAPAINNLVALLVANLPSKLSLASAINRGNEARLTAIIRAAYSTFIVAEKKKKIKDAKISKDSLRDENVLRLFEEFSTLSGNFLSASTNNDKFTALAHLYLTMKKFYDFAISLDTLVQSESKSGSDYAQIKSSFVGATYFGILYRGIDSQEEVGVAHSINSNYFGSA